MKILSELIGSGSESLTLNSSHLTVTPTKLLDNRVSLGIL
jgi:hypothetical protein